MAWALRLEAETRGVAEKLEGAGIPVLRLKGPGLQLRLYDTPAAYPSGDVDLLIPRRQAPAARGVLERHGWLFDPDNGFLWRLSRAASFSRDGIIVDLHWGLHAAHLPAWSLRPLERELWARAKRGAGGLLEPDPESLQVYLALHAAGHRFAQETWVCNVAACSRLVTDWDRVWVIARKARLSGTLRWATAVAEGRTPPSSKRVPLLDGAVGRVAWYLSWVLRGHFLRRPARARLSAALRRKRRSDQ